MVYAAALLAASVFMLALRAMAIPAITARVITTGREAARVMGDRHLDDDRKEQLLQKASLTMMRAFGSITVRTAAAVAAAVLPLLAFHAAGAADMGSVAQVVATWQGILLTGAAMTAVYFVRVGS